MSALLPLIETYRGGTLECLHFGAVAVCDARGELVASAFSQRRKLLRHSLGHWLTERGYPGHFDLQRRAEEVPVDQFVALALEVSETTKPA